MNLTNQPPTRKSINFDLSTTELKKRFNNTAEAYGKIKQFMLKNGFEHRQYSGYVSKEPMKDNDITIFTMKIKKQLPWLHSCTQKIDLTDVCPIYDIKDMIADNKDALQQQKQQIPYTKDTIDKQNAIKQKVADFAKSRTSKESPGKDIER